MSTTHLKMVPVPHLTKTVLGEKLKVIFLKRFPEMNNASISLTSEDGRYLLGLRDGGMEEVEKIVEMINKHGAVKLWIEE